jgi:O-acetyl-ADP-ribose deacetylase (regulator of RNase III)
VKKTAWLIFDDQEIAKYIWNIMNIKNNFLRSILCLAEILMVLAMSLGCNIPPSGTPSPTKRPGEDTRTPETDEQPKDKIPMSQAEVKDKTAPPPLKPSIPALADTAGWVKDLSLVATPANIPALRPPDNKEYYRVKKSINGVKRTISVVYGDILQESDVIVNAANSGLTGGGGIDGAIHNAAKVNGKDLLVDEAVEYKALQKITAFAEGSAMVMNSYGLAPKIIMIVFTVGPTGPADNNKNLALYSAIYNSLLKASEYKAKSISIPAVSTGIFGYPKGIASELFFKAALQFFVDHQNSTIEHVRFTNFDQDTVQKVAIEFVKLFP